MTDQIREMIKAIRDWAKSSFIRKTGDTVTGDLVMKKSSTGESVKFEATRTDTGASVFAGVGAGGINHGIYSNTLKKWIVYADAENKKVYLLGNADTATKSTYLNVNIIAADTNLNNVTTAGFYRCTTTAIAKTLLNCPVEHAFFMIVGTHAGIYQEVIEYLTANPKTYMRNYYDGAWGKWYRVYTEADKPSASDVGAVDKTGDTMTGYLYNTKNTSNDDRASRISGEGFKLLMPTNSGFAGGISYSMRDDETTTISVLGYFHSPTDQTKDYFYAGVAYNNPNGKIKAGEFIGKLTGNADSASRLKDRGNVAAETGTNTPAVSGLSMSRAYNNGYPSAYGNIITTHGTGSGELFMPWSGTNGAVAHLHYRNKRDQSTAEWSPWKKIAFTDDDITGNAATATKATQDGDGNVIANSYMLKIFSGYTKYSTNISTIVFKLENNKKYLVYCTSFDSDTDVINQTAIVLISTSINSIATVKDFVITPITDAVEAIPNRNYYILDNCFYIYAMLDNKNEGIINIGRSSAVSDNKKDIRVSIYNMP